MKLCYSYIHWLPPPPPPFLISVGEFQKERKTEQYEETDGSADDKIHLTFTTLRDGELD